MEVRQVVTQEAHISRDRTTTLKTGRVSV